MSSEEKSAKVIKSSGKVEEFDPNIIVNNCLEAGIDFWIAAEVAMEVAKEVSGEISSKEIQTRTTEKLYLKNKEAGEKYRKFYSIYVRSSKNIIEDFDRKRIVASLVEETGIPEEIAEVISREAENDVRKMNLSFVSAPLLREIVNVKLLEKGYENERAKYTRLGLPIHDAHKTISMEKNPEEVKKRMAENIIREYSLLRLIPLHIGDAHMKGELHVHSLEYFPLKVESRVEEMKIESLSSSSFEHAVLLFLQQLTAERGYVSGKQSIKMRKSELANAQLREKLSWLAGLFLSEIDTRGISAELSFLERDMFADAVLSSMHSFSHGKIGLRYTLEEPNDENIKKLCVLSNSAAAQNSDVLFRRKEKESEADTIVQKITLNLARAAYTANSTGAGLFEILDTYALLAKEVFEIKSHIIEARKMPFEIKAPAFELGFAGLSEAVFEYARESIEESSYAKELAKKILSHLSGSVKKWDAKTGQKYLLSQERDSEVLKRLAALDYGAYPSKVKAQIYSPAITRNSAKELAKSMEKLRILEELQKLASINTEIEFNNESIEELEALTKDILKKTSLSTWSYKKAGN